MSEWEWSSLQNIAFTLEDIAFTLQKMEQKMPVPEGIISTSEGPVDPSEVELAEALLAVEDDEQLVELIEEVLPEAEADDL